MLQRMIGAARLNVHTYEDVENYQTNYTRACAVVLISFIPYIILVSIVYAILLNTVSKLVS